MHFQKTEQSYQQFLSEVVLNEGLTMVMRTFYITKDLSGDEGQEPGLSL